MSRAHTPEMPVQSNASRTDVPPGPRSLNPLGLTLAFKRAPLSFLTTMSQQYGDIWQFRLLKWPTVVLNNPNYLKHILQDKYQWYDKNVRLFDIARLVLGKGLATNADDKHWRQQRRLMQPTFHKRHIATFATTMVDIMLDRLQRWDTVSREGQPLAVMEEMNQIVLRIIGTTLLSTDISEKTSAFGSAFAEIYVFLNDYYHMPFPPLSVPTPRNYRFKKALDRLNEIVNAIIRQRRESNDTQEDILSMLLHATDEQTGERMSDQQLRDEVITILLDGSESTTATLTWIWYTLCLYPQAEQGLHEELDRVLGGRTPTVNDLPQLTYTRMIIDEALRLYPVATALMRRAAQDDEIGGYYIPRDTFILWSPYVFHRHPDIWEEPELFRPERFLPEQVERRPRFSYLPFGGGPHICIGNNFALMEMTLLIATVAQRYRMELLPGQVIEPMPLLTIRPSKEVFVYLRPRK